MTWQPVVRLFLALSCTVFAFLVLGVGGLKESHVFWTYSSPYPVWFRDLVKVAYYPVLGLETMVFLAMTAFLAVGFTRDRLRPILSSAIMCVNWVLYFVTLWIVFKDNIGG